MSPAENIARLLHAVDEVPLLTYHQRGTISVMVFEPATIEDIRRVQNFLQTLVAQKEHEAHAADWQDRHT